MQLSPELLQAGSWQHPLTLNALGPGSQRTGRSRKCAWVGSGRAGHVHVTGLPESSAAARTLRGQRPANDAASLLLPLLTLLAASPASSDRIRMTLQATTQISGQQGDHHELANRVFAVKTENQ